MLSPIFYGLEKKRGIFCINCCKSYFLPISRTKFGSICKFFNKGLTESERNGNILALQMYVCSNLRHLDWWHAKYIVFLQIAANFLSFFIQWLIKDRIKFISSTHYWHNLIGRKFVNLVRQLVNFWTFSLFCFLLFLFLKFWLWYVYVFLWGSVRNS